MSKFVEVPSNRFQDIESINLRVILPSGWKEVAKLYVGAILSSCIQCKCDDRSPKGVQTRAALRRWRRRRTRPTSYTLRQLRGLAKALKLLHCCKSMLYIGTTSDNRLLHLSECGALGKQTISINSDDVTATFVSGRSAIGQRGFLLRVQVQGQPTFLFFDYLVRSL